jgi:hypothetical protein
MQHVSRLTGLAIGCTALAACSAIAVPPAMGSAAPAYSFGSDGWSTTAFHAELKPRTSDSTASRLAARVRLEIVGEGLEYRMEVRNPDRELITEAYVYSVAAGADPGTPVMVLFTDGRFRDRFLGLRGTVSLMPSMKPSVITQELQLRPSTFAVGLRGANGVGAWTMEGRVNQQ